MEDGGQETVSDLIGSVVHFLSQQGRPQGMKNKQAQIPAGEGVISHTAAVFGNASEESVRPIVAYLKAVVECIEQAVEGFKGGSDSGFAVFSNSIVRSDIDKLYERLCEHFPDVAAQGSLETDNASNGFTDKGEFEHVYKTAVRLFSRLGRSMIDAVIQKDMDGEQTPAHCNEKARIHFLLDDIQMDEVVSLNAGGVTANELRYLYRCREALENAVRFYQGNKEVFPPWLENPALWNSCTTMAEVDPGIFQRPLAVLGASAQENGRVPIKAIFETSMQK